MQQAQSETSYDPKSHSLRPAIWMAMLIGAFALGMLVRSGTNPVANAADATPDATATRQAELLELNDLRTRVAEGIVCTPPAEPTATITPTPTNTPLPTATPTLVPPKPIGDEIAYGSNLVFIAEGVSVVPAPDGLDPEGQYLRVNLKVKNLTDTARRLPLDDLRLVDANGSTYRIDNQASKEIVGTRWNLNIGKSETDDRGFVFDVPVDAGDVFVLESVDKPEFRIELVLESRG